jgi:hypothetical protein
MRDFPQELVDQVIDELFVLVERGNRYRDHSEHLRDSSRDVPDISNYSLVSRAWVSPTQKHHFSSLHFDCPETLEEWCACIAPDPAGVSRHVRELVLDDLDPSDLEDLEGFEEHIFAFTRVECLTIKSCYDGVILFPSIMEWFLLIGSNLVDLCISNSPATPRTITSLLSALPLLKSMEMHNCNTADDMDETNPRTLSRVPFFEGANHLILRCDWSDSYPKGSLDWIPFSARFGRLEIDMACSIHHPDLVNQWLASSCTTLKNLTIRWDPDGMSRPK